MNPDQAYTLHTDWARAVTRPDTPTHEWLDQRCLAHTAPMMIPGEGVNQQARWRCLREPFTLSGLRRTGPTVTTNVILDWAPATDDPEETRGAPPTDVYAAEEPEPEALSVTSQQVIIPEHVYRQATPSVLSGAPTYYVTADMCTVMEAAAQAFDDFDLMPRMPSETGFVVLARPLQVPMPGGKTQPIRALAWTTWGTIVTSLGAPGQVGEIWSFASRKDDADFAMVQEAHARWPSKKSWRDDPDLLPCYSDILCTGTQIGPLAEPVAESDARRDAMVWLQDQTRHLRRRDDGTLVLPTPEEWEAQIVAAQARYDQQRAAITAADRADQAGYTQPYLAAFVLLLTQQITTATPEEAAPASVRLARKVNTRRPSAVTVVDVRRSHRPHTEPAVGGTGKRAPLDHRHLVGSHWKWQPYGKDRALRRRILVLGYVRGPEDKPLVVKPRVTRLS